MENLEEACVDSKYNTNKPNVFTCNENGASNLWKEVLWAAKVAKMRYRWHAGDGNNTRFMD
jgi:hypothetical protein